jgi:hypothetical protein
VHALKWLALAGGGAVVVILALVGVLRDLLTRGPLVAPLVEDDGLPWLRRRGPTAVQDPAVSEPLESESRAFSDPPAR